VKEGGSFAEKQLLRSLQDTPVCSGNSNTDATTKRWTAEQTAVKRVK